jgi:hypothetical protein
MGTVECVIVTPMEVNTGVVVFAPHAVIIGITEIAMNTTNKQPITRICFIFIIFSTLLLSDIFRCALVRI